MSVDFKLWIWKLSNDNSVHESSVEQSALESRYNNRKVAVDDLSDYEVIILTKIDLYSLKFFETKGSHFS